MSGVFPSKEFVSMKQGNEFKVKKHLDQGILSRKFFRENLLRPRILTTFVAEELFEELRYFLAETMPDSKYESNFCSHTYYQACSHC